MHTFIVPKMQIVNRLINIAMKRRVLFFLVVVSGIYIGVSNRTQKQERDIQKIQQVYEKENDSFDRLGYGLLFRIMPRLIQARHQRFAMRVSECSIGHRQYHSAFRLEDDWRTEGYVFFGLPTIGGY